MAYFHGSISSSALGMDTGLTVILPQDHPAEGQGRPCKALYLLHGLAQDATAWTRNTSIERYATEAGIAVVMPEV
jgi:S-formylglutathione hydrolase FrmB